MVDKIKRNIVEDSAVTEPKIAANSVEAATLNVTAITGLSEVTDVADTDKQFVFNFKVENIKIIPGSYDVVVSQKLLSKFTNVPNGEQVS